MNIKRSIQGDAQRVLLDIVRSLGGFEVGASKRDLKIGDANRYEILIAKSRGTEFRFALDAKERVTPRTALAIVDQLGRLPKPYLPVLYAPVVSPRVAEILKRHDVGYVDSAGNCWLHSPRHRLLVERTGHATERRPPQPSIDPFKPKSSRIVRAMLSQPEKGWQVRELAEDDQVQVSPGLVVKVKRTLIEEGYLVEHDKRVYLRDPIGLLNAWTAKYPGPAEEIPLYFRGEPAAAEQSVAQWCRDNKLQYALAGFSAAWRLAPEVRYPAATVYVEDRGFDPGLLEQLAAEHGGKQVDTGPNMYLWRPFDRSVFVGTANADKHPVTSALQTYLDSRRVGGRGEDAAKAVFEKLLSRDLQAVAKREQERPHGAV